MEFVYNDLGERTGMITFRTEQGWYGAAWPAGATGSDLTQWAYDPSSGELISKTDALNRSETYARAKELGQK